MKYIGISSAEIKRNFVFRVNVSNDSYMTKSEASACLSRAGAEAVGKVKMAFRETSLTVDQFLQQDTELDAIGIH